VAAEPVTFEQLERMAIAAAKSGLFDVDTAEQALALLLIGHADGVPPARALQEYRIIGNRPSLKADAMLARYQRSGGKVQWAAYTNSRVVGVFSHPAGGTIKIDWTIKRAREAHLGDDEYWRNYPRQMLRSRCISEGVRATFPGIAVGIYTVEEASDIARQSGDAPGPAALVGNHAALTEEEIAGHLKTMTAAADQPTLATAFAAAWGHAGQLKDKKARERFRAHYDHRKVALRQRLAAAGARP
jgi:hypothetical protein